MVAAYARAKIDREVCPLVLIGDGPLRAAIEADIARRALSSVQIPGFVDETTKSQRMKDSRWVVVPPHTNEDFGLTAIEARSLGVPCIITRDGGLPEAGGAQALICEPRDVEGLATMLERAAEMSADEYARRARDTREELKSELTPMSFYADAYRRLSRGEPAPN